MDRRTEEVVELDTGGRAGAGETILARAAVGRVGCERKKALRLGWIEEKERR